MKKGVLKKTIAPLIDQYKQTEPEQEQEPVKEKEVIKEPWEDDKLAFFKRNRLKQQTTNNKQLTTNN